MILQQKDSKRPGRETVNCRGRGQPADTTADDDHIVAFTGIPSGGHVAERAVSKRMGHFVGFGVIAAPSIARSLGV